MKKYIAMLLALSTLYIHHCSGMETMPTELVKEIIVRFSILNCPDYTEGREVLLSAVQVCKLWRDIIEKEYDAIITILAQQAQKHPIIAPLILTRIQPEHASLCVHGLWNTTLEETLKIMEGMNLHKIRISLWRGQL